jgi:hypothetical protein
VLSAVFLINYVCVRVVSVVLVLGAWGVLVFVRMNCRGLSSLNIVC